MSIVVSCVIMTSVALAIIIKQKRYIEELERRNKELRYNRINDTRQYRAWIIALEEEIESLNKRTSKWQPIEIPKGTIEAVRVAMKVSHPDNGGKSEDFIKYSEVYKKLTNKS